ncbi:MAG: T9SS type A sorting domain-containing protein [Saprospiraceae bacterium]|nr:T9SS type A sorting domain-containing protein [Saprospiraceae bacterium]
MKKSILTFIFILALYPFISGQSGPYLPTIHPAHEWHVHHTSIFPPKSEHRVYFFSDTPVEVNGHQFYPMHYYLIDEPSIILSQQGQPAYRQEDGQIWMTMGPTSELMIIDFALEKDDIYYFDASLPDLPIKILNKDTITTLDGVERIRIEYMCCQGDNGEVYCSDTDIYSQYLIEGMVDPIHLFTSMCFLWDNMLYSERLLCYYEHGQRVYSAEGAEDCTIRVSTSEHEAGKLSVYPNPVSNNFTIQFPQAESGTLQIFSSLGQLAYRQDFRSSSQEISVNTQQLLPGMYQLIFYPTNGNENISYQGRIWIVK